MDGTNYTNGFHTIPEEDQNGYHHERMDSNGASGSGWFIKGYWQVNC